MTKEQEKAIETLKKFKGNELQRDKLELNRSGGWKIGDIYKFLELNPAIETVLSMLKEKDAEIEKLKKENEHWKNGFEKELEDNRKNTYELLKQDLTIREKDKQIDLMAEFIEKNVLNNILIGEICLKIKCNNEECHEDDWKKCIKQYFKRRAKE